MEMIKDYMPQVFDNLNQFHVAKIYSEENKRLLPQLGKVICKYNLEQKVGVALLHKHFNLMPGERLVEQFTDDTVNIAPISNPDDNAIIPYMWKFDSDNPLKQSWFPLEFQYQSKTTVDKFNIAKIIEAETEFLQEMAVKLQELNLENVFAISVLHREAIALKEGQIRLETTNHTERLLTIAAVDRDSIEAQNITETLWYFTADSDFEVSGMCESHCYSHCVGHS